MRRIARDVATSAFGTIGLVEPSVHPGKRWAPSGWTGRSRKRANLHCSASWLSGQCRSGDVVPAAPGSW